MTDPDRAALGFRPHDHRACRAEAVAHARRACAERGLRLTPTREAVLDILLESHEALGAYEVLRRLGARGQAAAQPPVAYRALDFLVANGFVHRLEKRNAFIACARPGESHAAAFMICTGCGAVAEVEARPAERALDAAAEALGFDIARAVIEAEGACPACRRDDASGSGA